jgi:hypothetical protein
MLPRATILVGEPEAAVRVEETRARRRSWMGRKGDSTGRGARHCAGAGSGPSDRATVALRGLCQSAAGLGRHFGAPSPPARHRRTEPVGRAGPPRGSAGWCQIGLRLPVSGPVFAGLSESPSRLRAAAALPAAGLGGGGAPALSSSRLFPPSHSRQKPPQKPPRPPCAASPLFKLYFRKTGEHHLHT